MPPRKFHDWQEDHHRRLAAEQACILHDAITDIVKLSLGIDLAVGCRASVNGVVETEIATLVRDPAHDGVEWACEQISRRVQRQRAMQDNRISDKVLDLFCTVYRTFLQDSAYEIATTNRYGGTQLLVRSTTSVDKSKSGQLASNGLIFICFTLPANISESHLAKFHDGFLAQKNDEEKMVQLGPASLFNHHCDAAARNIEQFSKVNVAKGLPHGVLLVKPGLSRSILAGEELLSYYGDRYFEEEGLPWSVNHGWA